MRPVMAYQMFLYMLGQRAVQETETPKLIVKDIIKCMSDRGRIIMLVRIRSHSDFQENNRELRLLPKHIRRLILLFLLQIIILYPVRSLKAALDCNKLLSLLLKGSAARCSAAVERIRTAFIPYAFPVKLIVGFMSDYPEKERFIKKIQGQSAPVRQKILLYWPQR